jgi:hypothetical protein
VEFLIGVALVAAPTARLLAPVPVPADLVRWSPPPVRPKVDPAQLGAELLVRVQDEHGQAVAGVPVGGLDLGTWLELGTTDAEGTVLLEPPAEVHQLAALVPGGELTAWSQPKSAPWVLLLEAPSTCSRTVTVLREDGAPAADAEVSIARALGDLRGPERTDAHGRWSGALPCKRGAVTVRAPGHLEARLWPDDPEPFLLEGGSSLDLTVLNPDGSAAAGASVATMSWGEDGPYFTVVDADPHGRATLALSRHRAQHFVGASLDDGSLAFTSVWTLGQDHAVTLRLAPQPPTHGRTVQRRARDASLEQGSFATSCAPRGGSAMRTWGGDWCPAGPAILYSHGRAYEVPADANEIMLDRPPFARHQGHGAPPGAEVIAWAWPPSRVRGTEPWFASAEADAQGNVALTGLTPGTWRVLVLPRGVRSAGPDSLEGLALDLTTAWVVWPGHVTDITVTPPAP